LERCTGKSDFLLDPHLRAFTLNCWVLLEEMDRVFPVDIAKEKSVGTLKKEIKKEKQ
jgi:hypothetical protein